MDQTPLIDVDATDCNGYKIEFALTLTQAQDLYFRMGALLQDYYLENIEEYQNEAAEQES